MFSRSTPVRLAGQQRLESVALVKVNRYRATHLAFRYSNRAGDFNARVSYRYGAVHRHGRVLWLSEITITLKWNIL